MGIYEVWTKKFGRILIEKNGLKEARKWARINFGEDVKVQPHVEYKKCEKCDCQPCVCYDRL